MKVYSCVLLLFLSVKYFVWCDERNRAEDTHIKAIFMPLVYLRKYNNSNYSNTFPVPVIYIPALILPINFKHLSQNNSYLIKDIIGINNTVLTRKVQIKPALNNSESENEDIEVNFRQSLNRGTKVPKTAESKTDDYLSPNDGDNSNIRDLVTNTTNKINITSIIINNAENITTEMQDADESQIISNNSNLYPSSNYNNKLVDSLSLTTIINEEIKLPAVEDKRWKNFIVSANNSINKTSTSNNLTSPKREANGSKGPYSDASYNNVMIDQISVTTNSYTNVESTTARNDRWMRFSSLGGPSLKPTGFKPLAGLYYDGFLHTPLIKMPGFNPHGDYYYP